MIKTIIRYCNQSPQGKCDFFLKKKILRKNSYCRDLHETQNQINWTHVGLALFLSESI